MYSFIDFYVVPEIYDMVLYGKVIYKDFIPFHYHLIVLVDYENIIKEV